MFPPRQALGYAAQAVVTLQGMQGNSFLSLPERGIEKCNF